MSAPQNSPASTDQRGGDRLNYLNILLMVVSAVAAFVLPFHVFLFSYAVLGPLHYLTEISWLHEKRYFTKHRQDYLLLVLLAIGMLCLALSTQSILRGMAPFVTSPQIKAHLDSWAAGVIYFAFAGALAMSVLKKPMYRAFSMLFITTTAIAMGYLNSAVILFSVFVPTLIHVYIFTGLFVLYGALKSRSRSGLLSLLAFVGLPVLLYLGNDLVVGTPATAYVQKTYDAFVPLNIETIKLFHLGDAESPQQVYLSGYGILIMRFIAYAYTYHYLNWFSKTSVIRWHKVPKVRLAIVIALWLAAVGVYCYDYKLGIIVLYCLSFMHVFLEFPLNHLTIVGIWTETRQLFGTWLNENTRPHDTQTSLPSAGG